MQGIFAAARALAPAVVFIDEADVLGSSRPKDTQGGSGGGGGSTRTLAALLTALDGLNTGMPSPESLMPGLAIGTPYASVPRVGHCFRGMHHDGMPIYAIQV